MKLDIEKIDRAVHILNEEGSPSAKDVASRFGVTGPSLSNALRRFGYKNIGTRQRPKWVRYREVDLG